MLSMGTGTCLGFPDVCKTPPLAIPIPYPDIGMSSTAAPIIPTVLTGCTPTLNQLSENTVSVGDEAGAMGGLVSQMESGETLFMVGCITIFVGGAPAQRLTSVTGQNAAGMVPNAPGVCIAPSQTTVLALG